jgi:hypothetical protein
VGVSAVVVSLSLNGMIAYGIHDKNDMINELIKTGKFTEDEATSYQKQCRLEIIQIIIKTVKTTIK